MPKTVTLYSVLIASPSDVLNERRIIRQVIHDWNTSAGQTQGINLSPTMWETHATPEMGDRPQAIINKQLVEDCDILVGVFWTRMGSPTGVAESGSAEEIMVCMEAGKPVLIYFSAVAAKLNEVDLDQYQKLRDFRSVCVQKGLLGEFDTVEELRIKLHADLTRVANWLHKKTLAEEAAKINPLPVSEAKELRDVVADVTKQATPRASFEKLTKSQRDYFLRKAVVYLMDEGIEKVPKEALISVARGLYREETRTVEDLRREFLTSHREAMRQERKSDDVKKAASRLPKQGNK